MVHAIVKLDSITFLMILAMVDMFVSHVWLIFAVLVHQLMHLYVLLVLSVLPSISLTSANVFKDSIKLMVLVLLAQLNVLHVQLMVSVILVQNQKDQSTKIATAQLVFMTMAQQHAKHAI
jgi:hypothetical protein